MCLNRGLSCFILAVIIVVLFYIIHNQVTCASKVKLVSSCRGGQTFVQEQKVTRRNRTKTTTAKPGPRDHALKRKKRNVKEEKGRPKYLKNYTFYNEWNPSFPSVAEVVEKWMNETKITCLIDIGANVGDITSLGASRNKTLIAVEPLPMNLAKLYKLVEENQWDELTKLFKLEVKKLEDRVHVLPYAMSDNPTLVQMTNELKKNFQTTYIKHKDNKPGIPNLDGTLDVYVITLVDLIPFTLKCKQTVIKVDVQGHECYVFKDGQEFFKQMNVPLIGMQWNLASRVDPNCNKEMIKTLKSVNFVPFYMNNTKTPDDVLIKSIEQSRDLYDIIWERKK